MDIKEILTRGVEEIIVREDLEKKLASAKTLRIKFGVDPTRPDIHLGHAVVLWKLKALQDLGHTIIFLIGDYTTKIGDPSGRNTTRPMLSDEEIKANAKTYIDQVGKILDVTKTEIRYNSEWYDKMSWNDLLLITSKISVAQLIERDDFAKRLKEGNNIGMHELLYPVMQAYDSVVLKADVAFGSDQKFNELAGRDLQKKMGQTPQEIVITKILVGTDGKQKMSKSLDNYIGISDLPVNIFGKVMSIPDEIIPEYFELCTDVKTEALEMIKKELKAGSKNPRDIKAELAKIIVEMYYSAQEAEEAEREFKKVFTDRETPTNISEKKINTDKMNIVDLLVELELSSSKSEARRLVEQGGVEVANTKITDPNEVVEISDGLIIRAGKLKFMKVVK